MYIVFAVSLPSTELSDDSHIYADPSAYDDLSRTGTARDPVPHLDPANITIEAVVGRSMLQQLYYVFCL